MTKQEIMDYVVETPQNVNKNILGQKLDELQKNVSWNDLKDRPFYTETETILERQSLEFAETDGLYAAIFPDTLEIPTGNVTVFWDGVEYKCVNGGEIFGNLTTFGGEDTGEPFVFATLDSGWAVASLTSADTSHEIGIVGEKVHKMNAKYMPTGTVRRFTVTVNDIDKSADKTYNEIVSAVRDGFDVVAWNGFEYFNLEKYE